MAGRFRLVIFYFGVFTMQFILKLFRFWVILLFLALSGYFAIYNQEHISVSLPPWIAHVSVPAYMAFMAAFLVGATVVLFFFGIEHMRKMLEIRRLQKQLREQGSRSTVGGPLSSSRDEPSTGPSAEPKTHQTNQKP